MRPDGSVSIVVTSRNDDHGGDMLHRFKLFTEALLRQADRHSLSGELIVVEWNPPPGPRLHDVIRLSVKSDSFLIRFIEVPFEAHRAIRNSDVIPLFQMIAKNVGIRRARGKFVLATNPDILFSDAVISLMASNKLQQNVMYRIDRHDVPSDVPESETPDRQLAWCNANVLRIHRKRGSFHPHRRILSGLCAVIKLKWQTLSLKSLARRVMRLRAAHWGNFLGKTKTVIGRLVFSFYKPRLLIRRMLWGALRLTDPLPKVHTNGCGDFTLMSLDRWFELRGYPELPLWSMHIDSLLCYMAVAAGMQERILRSSAKIFHIEHQNSWVVLSPDQRLKTFTMKPWIDNGLLNELWDAMYRTHRPIKFNLDEWGLSQCVFDEVHILSGEKTFIKGTTLRELKAG